MKNYAISYVNYHDNLLKIYFIKADNEREAITKTVCKEWDDKGKYLPESRNDIIDYFFNADSNIAIEEIPDNIPETLNS